MRWYPRKEKEGNKQQQTGGGRTQLSWITKVTEVTEVLFHSICLFSSWLVLKPRGVIISPKYAQIVVVLISLKLTQEQELVQTEETEMTFQQIKARRAVANVLLSVHSLLSLQCDF